MLAGRIVEVEAYLGPHNDPPDPAAHTHRGPTPRNLVLFGPAGHAYMYLIYGKYFCANISCEREGLGEAFCSGPWSRWRGWRRWRAIVDWTEDAPARIIASGPSRLCLALGLTRPLHNGLDVTSAASPLQVRDDGCPDAEVVITPRIGIRHAVDWPLRFALRGNGCVSGPKRLAETSTKANGNSSVE